MTNKHDDDENANKTHVRVKTFVYIHCNLITIIMKSRNYPLKAHKSLDAQWLEREKKPHDCDTNHFVHYWPRATVLKLVVEPFSTDFQDVGAIGFNESPFVQQNCLSSFCR